MALYGYARISTKDQNQDRQVTEFLEQGILKEYIYCDIASGKDFNRPQYQIMKEKLQRGDTLIIKSIDRLGRNYHDIINEWQDITKHVKADIRVLDLPLLDTTIKDRDLTGTFISDIVLQILSYVAEQERNNIKQRQKEGIAVAKAQGKHLGRPRATYPQNFDEIYKSWRDGKISTKIALEKTNLKRTTFYKLASLYEHGNN